MKIRKKTAARMIGSALVGALLFAGCADNADRTTGRDTQGQADAPRGEIGRLDDNNYDSGLAEPGRGQLEVQKTEIGRQDQNEYDSGLAEPGQADNERRTSNNSQPASADYATVANLDYSDKDVEPLTLPELNSKVGRLKNTLADAKTLAKDSNEMNGYKILQERTESVAGEIQNAGPDISEQKQLEMTRKLLEVEAEVAEFDSDLTVNW